MNPAARAVGMCWALCSLHVKKSCAVEIVYITSLDCQPLKATIHPFGQGGRWVLGPLQLVMSPPRIGLFTMISPILGG